VRRLLPVPLAVLLALQLTACLPPEPDWNMDADGTCAPEQLRIVVQPREDADPELVAVDVLLVNRSRTECSLEGVPVIGIVSAETEQQIGVSTASEDGPAELVVLQPKATAYILVRALKALEDTATCTGERASAMTIEVPGHDDRLALTTSAPVATYCDEPARQTLRTSAVTAEPLVVEGLSDFEP
jgi:hypothetical protein